LSKHFTQLDIVVSKIKVPKGGFHSDAIEEPFWLPIETFSER